ncbi:hypothetical protein LWI29_000520 [Acer saccharum]|uniref:Uncharacterized protein n=1 Tax=Acer saccharum TaxID=4024 RepID=A0AA39VRE9_ACESA|nr:hypothetical protein LWI29_000520 [Acer saccharum]
MNSALSIVLQSIIKENRGIILPFFIPSIVDEINGSFSEIVMPKINHILQALDLKQRRKQKYMEHGRKVLEILGLWITSCQEALSTSQPVNKTEKG